MCKEPRINLDRLVANIVLDCTLLRWFAYNRRSDEVLAAIALQRSRARDTEVLDFLGPPLRGRLMSKRTVTLRLPPEFVAKCAEDNVESHRSPARVHRRPLLPAVGRVQHRRQRRAGPRRAILRSARWRD